MSDFWWWELAVTLRKALAVVIVVFLEGQPALVALLALLLASLVLHVRVQPYVYMQQVTNA